MLTQFEHKQKVINDIDTIVLQHNKFLDKFSQRSRKSNVPFQVTPIQIWSKEERIFLLKDIWLLKWAEPLGNFSIHEQVDMQDHVKFIAKKIRLIISLKKTCSKGYLIDNNAVQSTTQFHNTIQASITVRSTCSVPRIHCLPQISTPLARFHT